VATCAGCSPEGLSMVNQSAMVRLTARNLSAGWKIALVTRVSTRNQWRFEFAVLWSIHSQIIFVLFAKISHSSLSARETMDQPLNFCQGCRLSSCISRTETSGTTMSGAAIGKGDARRVMRCPETLQRMQHATDQPKSAAPFLQ